MADEKYTMIILVGFTIFTYLYLTGRLKPYIKWLQGTNKYLGIGN